MRTQHTHSIGYKVKELGLSAPAYKFDEILKRVKNAGIERKRSLTDEEFKQILHEVAA